MNNNSKAAVFILLGQSNAVGHSLPMAEEDKIRVPLKNVFGLSRELNQSFYHNELFWSGYTSSGMNLAEEQDNTYSVANCLAKAWQNEIDCGNPHNLPDLYIVHIAIGAQGVTEKFMWNPNYAKKLVPGPLGTVDIALYQLTVHVFSMLKESFDKLDKTPEIIGIHWRGGEQETTVDAAILQNELKKTYETIFDGFYSALGEKPKTVLHRIVCHECCTDNDPTGKKLEKMHYINEVFDSLAAQNENIRVFDVRKAPYYVPNVRGNGIFKGDMVHFTSQVNDWVAREILNDYLNSTAG